LERAEQMSESDSSVESMPSRLIAEGVAGACLLLWVLFILYHYYVTMGFPALVNAVIGRGGA
jgi:hypothetical protein